MANCCEESKNKCNQIVDIGYLKDFVEGTDISVTAPQGKGDDYCPTYEELSSGRIAPITNDLGPELNGRDGILVNPTPYTASSTSSGCCPSSNRKKVVRAEDLSLSYYNLTDFDSSVSSTTSLCNAEGWLNIGYTIVKRKKSIDSNGCSAKTITDSENFSQEADRETHGANICNNLGQEHPGGEVSCHTDPINYDMSYELVYPNRSETYIAEGSYAQEGMDLHIEWFNDLIDEIIENEGFEEGIAIGSVSSSDNVTIGEPTATASFSPQSVGASVEDGEIILNVGEYINTDDRSITVTLPYTVCNTNYTASSSAFTQSGKPFVPSTKSPSCYSYTTSSITSCGSQLYLCKYNTGVSNHMANWAYIDGMRLKVDENGYFNEQIAYSQHRHYINSAGTTAVDSNQERLGQHINAHAVYSADTNEANATFHVYTSRNATNEGMFEGVSDLVIVRLPCEVDTIGASSFKDCSSLEEYRNINQIEYIKNNAFENCSSLKVIGGGSSLKEIGDYAFHNCTTPTSVTLAASVNSVGRNAFENCRAVKEVTLPSSLQTINEETFKDCVSLETINLGNITVIKDSAFENCHNLNGLSSSKLKTIGNRAFGGCQSLTSVNLTGITTIDDYAFYNCDGIVSLNIFNSSNNTTIGEEAFAGCDGLESVRLDNVSVIGERAFYNCDGLTDISMSSSTNRIDTEAFADCDSLESVDIYAESVGDKAFYWCSKLESLYIGSYVEEISSDAFDKCNNLTSVTINSDYLTDYFQGNDIIEEVTFASYVTEIANNALEDCSSLTSVTISDRVTSIGDSAFYNCTSLTSVAIGDRVTSIGDDAFGNCSGLESVTIPDSVTSIGEHSFVRCTSLTSVHIGDGVTSIGGAAFYNCSGLTDVTIEATTPPTLGTGALFGISTDKKIYVPSGSVNDYKTATNWSNYAAYIEPIA